MSDTSMSDTDGDGGFLARWARRKAQVRRGAGGPLEAAPPEAVSVDATAVDATAVDATAVDAAAGRSGAWPQPVESAPTSAPASTPVSAPALEPVPLPTMEDVMRLTRNSDFARFVGPDVDPAVSNAAMKKLFSDPRYNVMDGLDTYIDDYNAPDPIPPAMLRKMNAAKVLGLVDDEGIDKDGTDTATIAAAGTDLPATPGPIPHQEAGAPAAAPEVRPDDDADL